MFLETDKIALRQIEQEDLAQIRDWRNDPSIRERTREYAPLNMLNQMKWLESLQSKRDLMFAIMAKNYNNRFIGVCGLTHIDWRSRSGEWAWYIGNKDARGKGYARHIAYLLLEYGFRGIGLHRIWGEVFTVAEENLAIYKKLGFRHEATLKETYFCKGQWWDSWIIAMLDREWEEIRIIIRPWSVGLLKNKLSLLIMGSLILKGGEKSEEKISTSLSAGRGTGAVGCACGSHQPNGDDND